MSSIVAWLPLASYNILKLLISILSISFQLQLINFYFDHLLILTLSEAYKILTDIETPISTKDKTGWICNLGIVVCGLQYVSTIDLWLVETLLDHFTHKNWI